MMGLLGNLKEGMRLNQIAAHLNQMNVPTIRRGGALDREGGKPGSRVGRLICGNPDVN
jgi:hypothetical protein